MFRKNMKLGAVALMVLALGQSAGGAAASQEREKVVLTYSTINFAFLPALVAEAMGFYEEAGLDAEILKMGSGSKAMAAAVSGNADVALGSPVSVLQARSKNSELVLFSSLITQVSSNIMISREWADKHGITDASSLQDRLKALKGATIGVTGVGSGSDQIVRYLTKLGGFNPDRDLNIVGLGSDAGTYLAALTNKRVDGISISAPTGQIVVSELNGVMLFNNSAGAVKDLAGYFYIGAAANKTWLEQHPETAAKVAWAIQRSLKALNDPQESISVRDTVHAKFFSSVKKETFDQAWPNEIKSAPNSGVITPEMMAFLVKMSEDFGGTKLDASLIEGSYDNKFAVEAEKALTK